jgi:hypothetical protein
MDIPFLNAVQVAGMLGVSRRRVGELASEPGFPPANTDPNGYRVWLRDMIVRWAVAHPDREARGDRPELPVFGVLPPVAERFFELAREEARALNHGWVGDTHLLLAMLGPRCPGVAGDVLRSLGISADELRRVFIQSMGDPFEPDARVPEHDAIDYTLRWANCEAAALMDEDVASEHVLLAAVNDLLRSVWEIGPRTVRDRVLAVTEGIVAISELPPASPAPQGHLPGYVGPRLARSPAGHDPLSRRPWGSVILSDASGKVIERGAGVLQYMFDRDGHPVLTTDGRPVSVARDNADQPVYSATGDLILEAFEVPAGTELRSVPQ